MNTTIRLTNGDDLRVVTWDEATESWAGDSTRLGRKDQCAWERIGNALCDGLLSGEVLVGESDFCRPDEPWTWEVIS